MSNQPRKKPPALNLKPFQASASQPAKEESRPSFYSEESTMITSLDEMERARMIRESALASPPSVGEGEEEAELEMLEENLLFTEEIMQPPSNFGDLKDPPAIQRSSAKTPPHISQQDAPRDYAPPYIPNSQTAHSTHSNSDPDDPSSPTIPSPVNPSVTEYSRDTSPILNPMTDSTDAQRSAEASSVQTQHPNHEQVNTSSAPPRLISFFNPRGGVGSTCTSANIGGCLVHRGQRVILVDMDLQMCAIPSSLDLELERSLAEIVMETSESGQGPVTSALDYHSSGLAILAQEGRINEIGMITPDRLPRFYEALSLSYDTILVDGLRSFSDHAVSVMDLSDKIVVMITQDIPAVRSARKALQLFERLGYHEGKVVLVVNRYQKRSMITLEMIEDSLDKEIDHTLSNDFPFISQAISKGVLTSDLNPKHKINREFQNLAFKLIGRPDLISPYKNSLLSKLFSRKK